MLPKTLLGFLCGLLVPGVLEPLCRHLQGTLAPISDVGLRAGNAIKAQALEKGLLSLQTLLQAHSTITAKDAKPRQAAVRHRQLGYGGLPVHVEPMISSLTRQCRTRDACTCHPTSADFWPS